MKKLAAFWRALAPLAFLWLVIGYFLQQQELIQNTQAMRAQADEIARTAERSFNLKNWQPVRLTRDRRQPCVLPKPCAISSGAYRACSIFQATDFGDYPSGEIDSEQMFSEQSKGDPEIFSRKLLEISFALGETAKQFDLFYKTEIRALIPTSLFSSLNG